MDLAKKADQLRDIEADALSAAGDDRLLDEPSGIDFKPSQVPGEAFVAAAKHNDQVGKTALKVFKDPLCMGLWTPNCFGNSETFPVRRFDLCLRLIFQKSPY